MNSNYKVCKRCVMDNSAKEFEDYLDGRCIFCKKYDEIYSLDLHTKTTDQKLLNSFINKIKFKQRKNKYDVIIGLSGGVDSSYVAYLVTKKYGLRALAVHVDNGWNTELSVANIEKIVKKLDIDLYTEVLDWREFSDIQLSFLKSGISNIEIPTDHAIWATMIRTASKFNVPYIFAGNNVVSESIMPESWLYGSKDFRLISSIQKQFGKFKLKTFPHLKMIDYVYFLILKKIKWIPLLNYVDFNKAKAKEFLISDLKWRDYGGKHYESTFTRFFHSYYLIKKFGYDLRKSYNSALICSGQISREEALLDISKPPISESLKKQDINFVEKKFNLRSGELDKIINNRANNYEVFPNQERFWHIFRPLISKFRRLITRPK